MGTPDRRCLTGAVLRFGKVALDLDGREVFLNGEIQHLEPQAFDVLQYLVRHRERVVAQTELLDAVWGDQFVSASALTTRIKEVRRAVGDDGRAQAVIKNVRARGYRFVAAVDGSGSAAHRRGGSLPRGPELIGRSDELDQILNHLAATPLVTLIGPGGVGKTSLAVTAARRLRADSAGEVLFVDLAAIEDPAAVLPGVRQAIGSTAPADDQNLVLAGLATIDGLVVIDNCEHLIDTVADVVGRVMALEGPVRFLATSRERLAIPGEQTVPIGPLTSVDARALFLERAVQIHPAFTLGVDDGPMVDRMMDSLDRLPLTIEMAAGRTSALGLNELADLLDVGPGILTSPVRAASSRHRTVDDLVRWSTELLSPPRRQLLTDLAAFAGAVEIDDIVGVLSSDGADRTVVVEGLAALVDRSLVSVSHHDRRTTYRLLETTKHFARTLEASTSIGLRHARWFADAADAADRDLRTAREPSGEARFRNIFAEIRAAHSWARANDIDLACRLTEGVTMYALTRMRSEPARWARDLSDTLSDGHAGRPCALALLAGNAVHRGDTEGAARLTAESFSIGVSGRTETTVRAAAADHSLFTGDFEVTHRHCDRLIEDGQRDGDLYHWAFGLSGRALALGYAGEPDRALQALDDHPNPPGLPPSAEAWLRFARGEALGVLGRRDEAADEYERGRDLAESVDGQYPLSIVKMGMVANLSLLADPLSAKPKLRKTLAEFQRNGIITHAVVTLRNIVDLLLRTREDDRAMRILGGLSTDEIVAIFGPRDDDVAIRRQEAAARNDPDQVEDWLAEGRQWSITQTIGYALQQLSTDRP